jgi:sodium-dependent phosphate cotransporter
LRLGLAILGLLALVWLLLLSVDLVSTGFKTASGGKAGAQQLFAFATNPIIGLMLGLFATALVQSSSTVTTVIVGLVAGGLPVTTAVPMIMGANIGTSVTNTLVSLGALGHRNAFRRSFAAATVHDWFNLLAVAIFLPLELLSGAFFGNGGILAQAGGFLAALLSDNNTSSLQLWNPLKATTKPLSGGLRDWLLSLGLTPIHGGMLMILVSIAGIVGSVVGLGKLLKHHLRTQLEPIVRRTVGRGAPAGIATGTAVTVMVQSSSTTTSMIIPLAGSGVVTLKQVFPFTVGANIGTTITALIAATGVNENTQFALQIAFIHLLFNMGAMAVINGIPGLRSIPLRGSVWLSQAVSERRGLAFAWVIGVFFLAPAAALMLSKSLPSRAASELNFAAPEQAAPGQTAPGQPATGQRAPQPPSKKTKRVGTLKPLPRL